MSRAKKRPEPPPLVGGRGHVGGHGRLTIWGDRPGRLMAATDASCKNSAFGVGYIISNGQYGLKGRPAGGRLEPTGRQLALVNELRAVAFLLDRVGYQHAGLTVLLDSLSAITYLRRWQAGDQVTPPGYSLRERIRTGTPTLVHLAARLPAMRGVVFEHVKGHSGHLLNEAADSLAHMARRRVRERFDLPARAADLVDAFLRCWHDQLGRAA